MNISYTPQRRDDTLTVSVSGDILTVNGEEFDFSAIAEGDLLPRDAVDCAFIASDVTRTGGLITLTLIEPQGGPTGA